MLKQYITTSFLKKLIAVAYDDMIYPMASAYVKKTENKYDDTALAFLHDFLQDFLSEVPDQKPLAGE